MTHTPSDLTLALRSNLQTGTVIASDDEGGVRVELGAATVLAQCAVAGGYEPAVGDLVLVASDISDAHFLIGVLRSRGAIERRVATRDGVAADVALEGEAEVLRVRDRGGRLLLEHRAGENTTVLHAAGDLEMRADHGSIRLVARDNVDVTAKATRVAVEDASLKAERVTTVAERIKQVVGVLETSAGRILERARNSYREVEELSQTRAGRIKLVAQRTFHLLSDRALLKAKDDVKIKGEKIYLA